MAPRADHWSMLPSISDLIRLYPQSTMRHIPIQRDSSRPTGWTWTNAEQRGQHGGVNPWSRIFYKEELSKYTRLIIYIRELNTYQMLFLLGHLSLFSSMVELICCLIFLFSTSVFYLLLGSSALIMLCSSSHAVSLVASSSGSLNATFLCFLLFWPVALWKSHMFLPHSYKVVLQSQDLIVITCTEFTAREVLSEMKINIGLLKIRVGLMLENS